MLEIFLYFLYNKIMRILDNKKYMIITYGCQMNVHESEKIAGIFDGLGALQTNIKEDADYIVFNTCCIREAAEDKAFGNISALKPYKKKNPNLKIIVCGCLPQQKKDKYNIVESLKIIDILIGTYNTNQLEKYIIENINTNKRVVVLQDESEDITEILNVKRDDFVNAYVNIMYGCNNFCTYCIVPYVRGRERSRNIEDIEIEIKNLVNQGYKYITLLGQNVNSYGFDFNNNTTFSTLLKRLCQIDGDFKIKFMTSHPKDFSDELIEIIAQDSKMSKSIHLPVQSGSNAVLSAMNRRYTIEHYKNILQKLRDNVENVTVSTDLIVGFPNETQEDFDNTAKLIEDLKFSQIFAYMYSIRTGTPAAEFDNQISFKIKNERVNKILNKQKQLSEIISKKYIGKTFDCLIKQDLNNRTYAETDFGRKILVDDMLSSNKFVKVIVTDYTSGKLLGKLL